MRRLVIPGLLGLALLAAGCTEDSDGTHFEPGGDANGTWVVQRASGTTYLRVLPSTIEMFVEGDTCFEKTEYAIMAIDGPLFTVSSEGGPAADWTVERVGDALSVVMNGEALTLEPAAVDLNTLSVCGGPEPDFPHPGCSNIPQVAVGGSQTGALGEGSPQWSDDTWYDLWSIQLDAPQSVTITMTSDDQDLLDPYLLFYDAFGATRIDENDDIDFDGGNYNSRIGPIDLDAGCYIIVAGSWQGDDEGEVGAGYSISVQ